MRFRRQSPIDDARGDAYSSAVPAEEYVNALYQACLGRPADPDGRAYWSARLREDGDAPAVLIGILASDEARARLAPDNVMCAAIGERALAALGRIPRIVDIGAQSLGEGTHAYSALTAMTPLDVVGFDPLTDRLTERATTEDPEGGSLTLLPYAVGDGDEHTLHINNDDATSSLFALNSKHNAVFNHLSGLHTVRTQRVQTRRLDDVLPHGTVDFMKLDVQGAELQVLQHARRSLASTGVVHCEVEFGSIYAEQPLYPEIHTELASHGFYLVDFQDVAHYHYLDGAASTPDRLLWADAVFFRETEEHETLAAQALVAAVVYRKPSLAGHLLARIEK